MSYDHQTVAAIMEMASPSARSELLRSAITKRDYVFLDAVIATSGLEHMNNIGGLGKMSIFERSLHPLETAVQDDDATLLDWVLEKDLKINGIWRTEQDQLPYPAVTFPALEDALTLGRRSMVPKLLKLVHAEPNYNYVFASRDSQKKFADQSLDNLIVEGMTPLGCALVHGWDDLVGELLAHTRETFEYDLLLAVKGGSAHVDAIAAKLKSIAFVPTKRRDSTVLKSFSAEQRAEFFGALTRHAPPMDFGGADKQPLCAHVISGNTTVEEARFYLTYPGLAEQFKSRKVSIEHNMLGAAVDRGNLNVVQWLVGEVGVDPNGPAQQCPDLISAYAPPVFLTMGPALDYLVKMGANINVEHPDMLSPLIKAVRSSEIVCIQKMLELGADVAMKVQGKSALQVAKGPNADRIKEMIRSARTMAAVSASVGVSDDAASAKKKSRAISPL